MGAEKSANDKKGYLFTVEILVEGYSNGIALESLLNLLNSEKIKDYQITKGIEIGKIIEATLEAGGSRKNIRIEKIGKEQGTEVPDKQADQNARDEAKKRTNTDKEGFTDQVERYKQMNSLVRLTIKKREGTRLSIPCRILNFDPASGQITVYHVDEKRVYQFHIDEIEALLGY